MTFADIVGIGVSVLDTVLVVPCYPDEEAVMQAASKHVGLGGGVSVAMATAASLGASAIMLDRLGRDASSDLIVESLDRAGVLTDLMLRDPESTASVASIWVNRQSATRTIVFSPGSQIELTWNDAWTPAIQGAKVLHLNGRHLAVSKQAIEIARTSDVKVSYDGGAHRYRSEVLPIVRQADWLVVSKQFAQEHSSASRASPLSDLEELCQCLLDGFDSLLVGVTDGHHGSQFATRDGETWHQPAVACENLIDTTGCGDTFHGALLYGYVQGWPLRQCSQIAARVASHQAGQLGAFSQSIGKLTPEA